MTDARVTTTDGRDVAEVRAEQQAEGNTLHSSYIVLTAEERAKGFVRPVRRTYVHVGIAGPKNALRELTADEHGRYGSAGYVAFEPYEKGERGSVTGRFWTQAQLDSVGKGCGMSTTMGTALAETYARDPHFYGSTYCVECHRHFRVGEEGEFVWDGPNERVGS